jgi:hypothetical protein
VGKDDPDIVVPPALAHVAWIEEGVGLRFTDAGRGFIKRVWAAVFNLLDAALGERDGGAEARMKSIWKRERREELGSLKKALDIMIPELEDAQLGLVAIMLFAATLAGPDGTGNREARRAAKNKRKAQKAARRKGRGR